MQTRLLMLVGFLLMLASEAFRSGGRLKDADVWAPLAGAIVFAFLAPVAVRWLRVRYWPSAWDRAARDSAWRESARRLGARLGTEDVAAGRRLTAAVGSAAVVVRERPAGLHVGRVARGADGLELSIEEGPPLATLELEVDVASTGLDPELELSRPSLGTRALALVASDAPRTGDASLDDCVLVAGDRGAVMAALATGDARALVREVCGLGELSLREQRLVLRVSLARWGADELVGCVQRCLRLVRALSVPKELQASALTDGFRREPSPSVRLRLLEALIGLRPEAPETGAVLEEALADSDPEVRALASRRATSPRAVEVLRSIVADEGAPAGRRRAALERLAQVASPDALVQALVEAVDCGTGALRREAAALAAQARDPRLFEPLRGMLLFGDEDCQAAAAAALGRWGDERAESSLLGQLTSAAPSVRLAAAEALGRVGTLRCVPSLSRMAETGSDAAAEAVRSVQERHGRGPAGALSIASPSEVSGAVSLGPRAAAVGGSGDVALVVDRAAGPDSTAGAESEQGNRSVALRDEEG